MKEHVLRIVRPNSDGINNINYIHAAMSVRLKDGESSVLDLAGAQNSQCRPSALSKTHSAAIPQSPSRSVLL